jgi:transcriptional regulator with XRE-family HTH domain
VASAFAKRLRDLREERGLSQEELGARIGVDRSTVTSYETEKSFPKPDILPKIASYFDVSIDYLMGQEDDRRSLKQLVREAVAPDPELREYWEAFLARGAELGIVVKELKDLDADTLRTIVRYARAAKKEKGE